MSSLTVIEQPIAFHMSINVTNLDRAVAFYRLFFGMEPSKCHPDYAKFDLADPPVVFSLMPGEAKAGGVMSHLGLRLTSKAAMRSMQQRLEAAGLRTREQNETRGCYAIQTKVWVEDPDGNPWEIYIVSGDLAATDVSGGCMGGTSSHADATSRVVVYKGPFRQITNEDRVFPRGVPVDVPTTLWEELRQGPAANQFVFTTPPAAVTCR